MCQQPQRLLAKPPLARPVWLPHLCGAGQQLLHRRRQLVAVAKQAGAAEHIQAQACAGQRHHQAAFHHDLAWRHLQGGPLQMASPLLLVLVDPLHPLHCDQRLEPHHQWALHLQAWAHLA